MVSETIPLFCSARLGAFSVGGGALAVYAEEDCQEDGEAPEGGASVAEEGQGDSYYGRDAQYHSYIYK